MSTQETKTHWKCTKCGYTVATDKPPLNCPQCNEACEFKNVECYLPDCGGPGNIDPRL
jgi:rubrerythrin